jgi:predicted nucleic acid-binding protein
MSVVIDANLPLGVVLVLPYASQATTKIDQWQDAQVRMLAPMLWEYEVVSGIRRALATRSLTATQATFALRRILGLGVECLPPTTVLHERALHWAEQLRQSKAYDAHYLALAEQMGCEFWTADERLFNNARQLGLTWVRWIGEE